LNKLIGNEDSDVYKGNHCCQLNKLNQPVNSINLLVEFIDLLYLGEKYMILFNCEEPKQKYEAKMEKKYRMLIIDDSEETVAGLQHFFSKKYEVLTAGDGMEGLKLFENEEKGFDLVITDLVMPYISGVGVISIIKKKYAGTPVIAITGWGEHPGALATEAQADIVLEKPIELPELEKLVDDLLAKKKS